MTVTSSPSSTTGSERFSGGETSFWRNVVETYGARLFVILMSLAMTVIVSRTLGPTGRGLFAVATAVGAIGVQFGNLGLHASNTYYVAKNRELLPTLVGNSLVISFGIGGVGALIAWVIFWVWPGVAPVEGVLLTLGLAWIPLGLAYMLLQNLLLGIEQTRTYNTIELASKFISLGLLGLAIGLGKVSAEVMFSATLAGVAVSFLWVLWRLRAFLRGPLVTSFSVFRENIGVGLKAYFIAFFGFLVLRIDLLMVKYMAGAQLAGYYSISASMAENILTLPIVVGIILFPKLSRMANNQEKLRLIKTSVFLTAGLLLPMMIAVSVFATPLVELVFGKSFLPAVGAFVWLMPGTFFLGLEIVLVQYLNSMGFPAIVVYSWLLVTLLNVLTNLWAIPAYGVTGAAIVSTVSYFLIFVMVLAAIWREQLRQRSEAFDERAAIRESAEQLSPASR